MILSELIEILQGLEQVDSGAPVEFDKIKFPTMGIVLLPIQEEPVSSKRLSPTVTVREWDNYYLHASIHGTECRCKQTDGPITADKIFSKNVSG